VVKMMTHLGGIGMSVKQIDGDGKFRTHRKHSHASTSEAKLENVLEDHGPDYLIETSKVIQHGVQQLMDNGLNVRN
jgi:hypothetical protein